jgi:hypothetical protein
MSYQSQAQLEQDPDFQGRSTASAVQQAAVFKDDQRPDFVALAERILVGDHAYTTTFTRLDVAGPGIADKVDQGDGTIDQTQVTDADLLSLTQANFPVIADLFFTPEGEPKQ